MTDRRIRQIKILLGCTFVLIWIIFMITQFACICTTVHGISMQATLMDNDKVLVNKLTYKFNDPQRYDIVLVKYSEDEYYIKRIIGMPGDKFQIKNNGYVYIDDEKILKDYGFEKIKDPGIFIEPVILKDDEYVVLGDNRNFSTDSRDESVGIIKKDALIGRTTYCVYPFDRMGYINNDANKNLSEYKESNDK